MTEHTSAEAVIRQLLGGRDFNFLIGTLGEGHVMPSNEAKNILVLHFKANDYDVSSSSSAPVSISLIFAEDT
jgi:hypothetical protein